MAYAVTELDTVRGNIFAYTIFREFEISVVRSSQKDGECLYITSLKKYKVYCSVPKYPRMIVIYSKIGLQCPKFFLIWL